MRLKLLVLFSLCTACFGPKRLTDPVEHSSKRSQQLMVLAAGEARHIQNADVRLTRQLNIANEIVTAYGKDGAVEALNQATETLHTVGSQLSGHALLAGWVSVAELARRASDSRLATQAVSRAVSELERIPDPAERCDYVMGVAEEVSHTISAGAAAGLLVKSGDWASSILVDTTRRNARLAFASALFNLEDYDSGAGILRKEGDPLWSSDAMMRLAQPVSYYASAQRPVRSEVVVQATAERGYANDSPTPPAMAQPQQQYGKQLGFSSMFEGRTESASEKR